MELLAVLQRPPAVKRGAGVGYSYGNGSGSGMGSGMGGGSGGGSGGGNGVVPPPPAAASVMRLNQLNYFSPAGKTTKTEIRTDESLMISTGVVNGKALELPRPAYSAAARSVSASGAVVVQVLIDESGKVISANAVSGHPLLRAAAQKAASRARFTSTNLSGQPVKVTGVIVYNFIDDADVSVTVKELPSHIPGLAEKRQEELTPEILKALENARIRTMLAEKLQFWVFAAVERMQSGETAPALHEDKFVSQGMANIEIVFAARTPETIEKLKAFGMQITLIKGALRAEGIIPAEKLAELAIMEEVKLILPKMR
jgi:TonB family protein